IKFFSSIFGSGESKTPAAEEKPKHGRDRNDRNRQRNRGQNGRNGRNGRNPSGPETEDRAANPSNNQNRADKEANKPATNEANAQARQNKPARPPREEKEVQEGQGRRDRQQRQREAKKDTLNSEVKVEEVLNPTAAIASAPALNKAKAPESQISAGATEQDVSEPQTEEGRRRRRGGRNRNRRDRNGAENTELNTAQTEANGEAKLDQPPAFIPVADLMINTPVSVEAAPAQASFDLAPTTALQSTSITEQSVIIDTEISTTPVPVADVAIVTTAVNETVVSIADMAESTTQETISEISPDHASVTLTAAPAASTAISSSANDVVSTGPLADATLQTSQVTPVIATPVAVNETLPMFTEAVDQQQLPQAEVETVAPVIAEMPAQVTTATNAPVISVAPTADLSAVLAQAGLILASTDPSKLKAAQEATTQAPVAPRVIRERKAPVAAPDEPLVLVETKR
ncbi:MAG: hypothetical protein ACEQSE_13555, partial [Candidatus Aquirickettsiella gammari]